jgi:hypothetical protein
VVSVKLPSASLLVPLEELLIYTLTLSIGALVSLSTTFPLMVVCAYNGNAAINKIYKIKYLNIYLLYKKREYILFLKLLDFHAIFT